MASHVPQYDDPLDYEKAPSLSFRDAAVGTMYKGVITARPKLVQSRDFESGDPKTWPDGNPVMSVVIILEVDGEARSLWAQRPSSMFAALVEAQKTAGAGPMEEGGTLHVKFIGEKPNAKNPRLNPAKQYAVKYTPPDKQPDPFVSAPEAPGATSSPAGPVAQANPTKARW
jgi:hypothetical protein